MQAVLIDLAEIPFFDRFWFLNVDRKFVSNKSGVLVKNLLLFWCQQSQYFLDQVQLIYLRLTLEESLPIGELSHDATNRPHVYLLGVLVAKE